MRILMEKIKLEMFTVVLNYQGCLCPMPYGLWLDPACLPPHLKVHVEGLNTKSMQAVTLGPLERTNNFRRNISKHAKCVYLLYRC